MSSEQSRFMWSNKCPLCRRFTFPKFELPDGTRLGLITFLPTMNRAALARCGRCKGTWPVFAGAPPAAVAPACHFTVEVVETARTEEPLGDEIRRIDNSGSATSVRRLKATRRWTQRCEVLVERTQSTSSGMDLSPGGLLSIKTGAEDAVKRTYSMSMEDEQTFEEEVELTLLPHTAVVLTLHWKRIWQEGLVIYSDASGLARVPYRAVSGITFDQTSVSA
ncbi:hypothetical protein [Actinokineospora sp.]|uniref:hypothetical protein n=1 Tax=Actinokineospora sp. TaxID=1872133 RepID=UPI004037D298